MLDYRDTTHLAKHFGDFGGNEDMSDFETGRLNPDIDGIVETIESGEFEAQFRRILPAVCGEITVKTFELVGGRVLHAAPALAKRYALAARLAHAVCLGKRGVALGSPDRGIVLAAAAGCALAGLTLHVTLGKSLALDRALVAQLREGGAVVDDVTCARFFDLPHAYIETPFVYDPENYLLEVEANYGAWPRPALTGVFAGLYGADLLAALGKAPEACVVPISTGTEAIGVFKALKSTGCALATCEPTVAQEYHIIDTNAYTISTRGADEEKPETTICPELANMWHKARVMRLGCDRLYDVDVSAVAGTGISYAAQRAAVLAFEEMDCSELLVLEG